MKRIRAAAMAKLLHGKRGMSVANDGPLRVIAAVEAAKGVAVLLLAAGVLELFHGGEAGGAAHSLVVHLQLHPDRRLSRALLEAMTRVTDTRMWVVAMAAVAYSTVRFTEAWGLWWSRAWAQWLSMLSGLIYLPWEWLELAAHRTWTHATLIVVNLAVVSYMVFLRLRERR